MPQQNLLRRHASLPAVLSLDTRNAPASFKPVAFQQDFFLPPGEVNDLMKKGRQALNSQKYAEASEFFSQALLKDPKNSWIDLGLADVALAQGNVNSAEVSLRNALAKDPNNQLAYWGLQNIAQYKSVQSPMPPSPAKAPAAQAPKGPASLPPQQPRFLRSDLRQYVGKEAAKKEKEGGTGKKEEIASQYLRALLKGRTALMEGHLTKAEKCYQAAVILTKKNADAYIGLGEVAKEQKQYPLALQYFSQALQQDPHNSNARVELGNLRFQQQDYDAAVVDFKIVLDSKDESVIPLAKGSLEEIAKKYREFGIAAQQRLDPQTAQNFYQKAADIESYRPPNKVRKSASEPELQGVQQGKESKRPKSASDETTQAS